MVSPKSGEGTLLVPFKEAQVLSPDRLPLKEFLNDLPTTNRRCALLYSLKRISLTAVNGNLEQCRRILHLQDTKIQGLKLITIKSCHIEGSICPKQSNDDRPR